MIDFKIYSEPLRSRVFNFVSCLTLISTALLSQSPIENGFELLESGEFAAATDFFYDYLQDDPNNKTAKICYGRALGLSSDPVSATKLFEALDKEYIDDLEVDLNLAESWLWQKKYAKARQVYDTIISEYPESFPGLLGAANTYSNLKLYAEAKALIDRALNVDPANPGGLTSQKYILLGLGESLRAEGAYREAREAYENILSYEPYDRNTLVNYAINYILWGKLSDASQVYQSLLGNNIDSLGAYLGLSYVELLSNNTKRSLRYALKASSLVRNSDSYEKDQYINTLINEVNAYGVNGKFKKSRETLIHLLSNYGSNLNVQLAEARINLWARDKHAAKDLYDPMIRSNGGVYDVIMNYVDLLRGYKEDEKAVAYLDSALMIIPGQPDAQRVRDQILSDNNPIIMMSAFRGTDNGGNLSDNYSAKFRWRSYRRFEPIIEFKQRNSYTEFSSTKLSIPRFTLGGNYRISHNSSIEGGIGIAYNTSDEITNKSLINIKAAYNTTLAKHHNVSLKYFTDFQDFTAGLVNENLKSSNYELTYLGTTYSGFGLYSQLMHTVQNDNNQRQLIFLSAYYDIDKVPNVKVGINSLYFTFSERRPTIYFSPSSFYSFEAFISSQNLDNRKVRWLYRGFLAYGSQRIESQDRQSTLRIEAELGTRINADLVLKCFYNYSNAAQSSATGFSYKTYGVRFSYIL